MEKNRQKKPDLTHWWKQLRTKQKRAVLTIAMFAAAAVIIAIALIVGISSCKHKSAQPASKADVPIPALLRAPQSERQQAETQPAETPAPADPDSETIPDGEEPLYKPLKKHDRGEDVTDLQSRLMELGYLEIEEPTDYYGSSTEYAVELFQRQHGLTQDGVAGEQTLTALYSIDAHPYMILEGAEGRDVKMLQQQLVELGYLESDDVDRIYGEKTVEAVKAFQKRNGLTQDGKAGEKTLEKLFSDEAKMTREMEAKVKAEEKAAREQEEKENRATPKSTPTPKSTAKTTPKKSPKNTSKATSKPTHKATPKPTAKPTAKKETKVDRFIKAANSKIGCEYVLGDIGPKTFDCSGLVYYCLKQAGVSTTRLNAAGFSKVSRWKNITKIDDLKKGDILFFRSDSSSAVSHTGIYIGSGMMIDASSSNGKVVKRSLSAYWKRNFVNARRPWA